MFIDVINGDSMTRYIIWGYRLGDQYRIKGLILSMGGKVISVGVNEPYVIADINDEILRQLYASGYVRLVEKAWGGFRPSY